MDRRVFLKHAVTLGAGATAVAAGYPGNLFSAPAYPDLAAVMGGEPEPMFDRGIDAMGGMKRFVRPNQTVVIKPNIGWDTTPRRAANTNPRLIRHMVKHCLDAGAKKVYVFDHTADAWQKCYERSGIKQAVKDAGGTMVPGNSMRHYHKISVPRGRVLKHAEAHELFLEADVFINVPVLKNHIATRLTMGMKNLMGVVWDRGWWHRNDLHQCIADFTTFRIPDLTVIDAYRVLKVNGPMGVTDDDTVLMKALLMAKDPVAADTAACRMFGMDPSEINYMKQAQELGLGTMDLASLNIRKIRI
ncbi:MAG: DUF362 domain-containing protein [Desulfobacterales bacterium]|nr:DUF362 domain-containing protein [Desulfobacterales bacterium]